jgi:signal transduction histidine kinase
VNAADQIVRPLELPHEHHRAGALVALLRLHWFITLRWGMVLAAFAALALERFIFPEVRRPAGLLLTVVAIAVVNVAWMLCSRWYGRHLQLASPDDEEQEHRVVRIAQTFAAMQVAIDLLLLTVLLRYLGGIESPLSIFYLFHMAICSLLLGLGQAIGQGIWALALYTALAIGQMQGWIGHDDLLPQVRCPGVYHQPPVVIAAVAALACGIGGILYFTLRIATRLDERERQLRAAMSALEQSKKAIQDLQARRSRFMLTAAHQLKSPMAAIQTMAGLIRDRFVEGEGVLRTTESIIRRCQEGTAGVTELLTLARVQDADPARHAKAIANVAGITLDVCNRRQAQAEQKGLTLTRVVTPGVDVHARVQQADLFDGVDNLVDNAIKYTERGGVTVTVGRWEEGEAAPEGVEGASRADAVKPAGGGRAFVTVSVQDTGIGIAQEELIESDPEAGAGSVFDAYRRGNGALERGISGSGLGLSIVREVVEQAGGRIRVRSAPGKGTTFTLLLPAGEAPPEAQVAAGRRPRSIIVETDAPESGGAVVPQPASASS